MNEIEIKNENKKKHSQFFPLYVMLTVVLVISLVGTSLSTVVLLGNKSIAASVVKDDDKTTEDDVTIADEYVIRSTTNISDAYKSGKTDSLSDKDKETLDMASAVLKEIIKDDMSDYDKEKAVYDWMTTNLKSDTGLLSVIPTTQDDCDNPYGVLKYHNAVCVGYATTFRLFMQMMDIPCMVVHNNDKYHSWDLVQLDGSWYHTDIYSDAESSGKSYAHFNLSDSMMESDAQSWDKDFYPAATDLKYNYIYQNAETATDVYQIPSLLRKAMDDKSKVLALKFGSDLQESDAKSAEYMMSEIQEILDNSEKYYSYYISSSWTQIDEGYLFVATISGDDDSEEESLSKDEIKKIEKAVNNSFSDISDTGSALDALTDWFSSSTEAVG